MNTRTRNLLKAIIIIAILTILTILAVQTFVVGFKLATYSSDIVESERYADYHYSIREEANEVYNEANEARNELYNSNNPYIRFLANMSNNIIRVPFALIMMFSPIIFFKGVQKYNISRRKRARM